MTEKIILNQLREPQAGWQSNLGVFHSTSSFTIQTSLESFVLGYSSEQSAAWREEIPLLQREAGKLLQTREKSPGYGAILEYQLPYDLRRPDVIVLAEGAVVVLELKGKGFPSQADVDQAAAYARDLRAYHRECLERKVHAVVVPTRAHGVRSERDGVVIASPDLLDQIVTELAAQSGADGPDLDAFLAEDNYCPLPTLVEAARELFESQTVREIWRARASTEPAVEAIKEIAHVAAQSSSRHLVLVSGVPGAGKTLVGMRSVHAKYLDDLAVERAGGKPTVPGLYLTGNIPLSVVLQYELRSAGGGGATFVRHIKSYLDRYIPRPDLIPLEHLLVFDEAQRAFSADKVADTHDRWRFEWIASEPELFIRICDRMPQWSVMVGLIGSGQEIHVGEEEGLEQWRVALDRSPNCWTVHGPEHLLSAFNGTRATCIPMNALNLNTEIRFHRTENLHEVVETMLEDSNPQDVATGMQELLVPNGFPLDGLKIYLTRDLEKGKDYLRERYKDHGRARFGLLASSRDKDLTGFGIANDFQATKQIRVGPWFTEGEEHDKSCRHLTQCVTEFQCQGLELDMALIAWGTDYIRENGKWTDRNAKRYMAKGRTRVRDPFKMRKNAYRVLLTRGRDGSIIYIPQLNSMDETWDYLMQCGFRVL